MTLHQFLKRKYATLRAILKPRTGIGKDLTYDLAVLLAHKERSVEDRTDNSEWFRDGTKHLSEMEIPRDIPEELKDRLAHFKARCDDIRQGNSEKEQDWAVREALDIIIEGDGLGGTGP